MTLPVACAAQCNTPVTRSLLNATQTPISSEQVLNTPVTRSPLNATQTPISSEQVLTASTCTAESFKQLRSLLFLKHFGSDKSLKLTKCQKMVVVSPSLQHFLPVSVPWVRWMQDQMWWRSIIPRAHSHWRCIARIISAAWTCFSASWVFGYSQHEMLVANRSQ